MNSYAYQARKRQDSIRLALMSARKKANCQCGRRSSPPFHQPRLQRHSLSQLKFNQIEILSRTFYPPSSLHAIHLRAR
ncbi:hypothetical protein BYT27DRAFT_7197983 [Phlegmacium glaucopus]|nr:hypothetical protein BYT27DRAFT_7197983 [Phlegmacium glaucopus]